jgi:hypothetical protein
MHSQRECEPPYDETSGEQRMQDRPGTPTHRRHGRRQAGALLAFLVLGLVWATSLHASAASTSALRRYPYLTDVTSRSSAVSWGTDRSSTRGTLSWGRAGSSCTAHSAPARRVAITVHGVPEYQWTARATGLAPGTSYCYRIHLGRSSHTDLVGGGPPPTLTTVPASSPSYSFAVLGDWGQSFANGNPHQAALLTRLKSSSARFVVFTGDTGYPAGTQTNYGDLVARGRSVSGVFASNFWAKLGAGLPAYATIGNHAPNATFLTNWPEATVAAASDGRWTMQRYPSVNGTRPASYPSGWYAFDVGSARYYVLDASWDDGNTGSGTAYAADYAAHWRRSSAEYKWLAADLADHPSGVKFAFLHYPLYSDQSTESSDTHLHGSDSLEGLLAKRHVGIAFSGHAHVYERNRRPTAHSVVSYVTGGGGARLQSIGGSGCSSFDAYGLGWKASTNTGSACGAARRPSTSSSVYHFLLVTVRGSTVTVRGVNETGAVFDSQTYHFSG